MTMNVESRDSVSLKPAELDEFSQLLTANGLSLTDAQLDLQVEAFPLAQAPQVYEKLRRGEIRGRAVIVPTS